jgi:hypothetical protein
MVSAALDQITIFYVRLCVSSQPEIMGCSHNISSYFTVYFCSEVYKYSYILCIMKFELAVKLSYFVLCRSVRLELRKGKEDILTENIN